MATKPKPSAAEIAERNMPGWKAVEPSGPIKPFGAPDRDLADVAAEKPTVDAVMPATRKLRAKFLGQDAADAAEETNAAALESDTELVDMKSGDIQRTVGVNVRTGKIDWSQG